MAQRLMAEHGEICSLPQEFFGYFGWPTVARMDDGTLVAAASGLRTAHVCPFGRTTICISRDEGRTWTSPRVITDTPLDDRDAGIVNLGGQGLLVSWFTSDNRESFQRTIAVTDDPVIRDRWERGALLVTDENAPRFKGAWVRTSADAGETWNPPVRVRASAPHGPIRLRDGSLLYLGKDFGDRMEFFRTGASGIIAIRSTDNGQSWQHIGDVPVTPGTSVANYHEPHVVELPSGKLIGMIRVQNFADSPQLEDAGIIPFSISQTESTDGGNTWSVPQSLGFHGSPPHLIRHSSGVLVMSYGYRLEPYGERIALSYDDGATWQHDLVLRDDAPDWDLGYPASVELADGSILTIYYQKPANSEDKCALLWSRWQLPAQG